MAKRHMRRGNKKRRRRIRHPTLARSWLQLAHLRAGFCFRLSVRHLLHAVFIPFYRLIFSARFFPFFRRKDNDDQRRHDE